MRFVIILRKIAFRNWQNNRGGTTKLCALYICNCQYWLVPSYSLETTAINMDIEIQLLDIDSVFLFKFFMLEVTVTPIFYRRIKHALFPSLGIRENHWTVLEFVFNFYLHKHQYRIQKKIFCFVSSINIFSVLSVFLTFLPYSS